MHRALPLYCVLRRVGSQPVLVPDFRPGPKVGLSEMLDVARRKWAEMACIVRRRLAPGCLNRAHLVKSSLWSTARDVYTHLWVLMSYPSPAAKRG